MRILFLTETIPAPLDSGGRIKTFHTLGVLSSRHEVHCHAFIREPGQRAHAAMLEGRCASLMLHVVGRSTWREATIAARAALTARAYTLARHLHRSASQAIADHARREGFDLVYCDHLSMAAYAQGLGLPVIYDAHNVEWQLVMRHGDLLPWPGPLAARIEAARVRREEAHACARAALVLAVSDVDAHSLRRLAPGASVRVVPIAIDANAMPGRMLRPPGDQVLFVGGLHWPPNAAALEWFLERVWPDVIRTVPAARLTCVGRATPDQRRRLERVPGVQTTGGVVDVEPWFRQAKAMVVPLRSGSGMRVKILDAFARRLPVVSTSVGYEGIEANADQHLLAADAPDAFARHVVAVLRDESLAEQLAASARHLVLERYDVRTIAPALLAAIDEAAGRGPTGRRQAD
jgi:glycosyltransferase involved in cell wall biosynthesis